VTQGPRGLFQCDRDRIRLIALCVNLHQPNDRGDVEESWMSPRIEPLKPDRLPPQALVTRRASREPSQGRALHDPGATARQRTGIASGSGSRLSLPDQKNAGPL
jgi:hypothetical protein